MLALLVTMTQNILTSLVQMIVLSTSKLSNIDSPVSGYTRSEVKQHQLTDDLGNDSNAVLLKFSVSNACSVLKTGLKEISH